MKPLVWFSKPVPPWGTGEVESLAIFDVCGTASGGEVRAAGRPLPEFVIAAKAGIEGKSSDGPQDPLPGLDPGRGPG